MSAVLIHSYSRKTGESVEVSLLDNGKLVVDVDGEIIHVERRWRGKQYTERTAKKRAVQYEQQDHDGYNQLVASNTVAL